MPHSLIMSKHNEFWHLHLCSHTLQQILLIGNMLNMLNILEEKSEEESWMERRARLVTAGLPSQEQRIYGTCGRAHSNSPVDFKLQEAERENTYRHNSVLRYIYSPCAIAITDPKAWCGAFGSSKVKRKNPHSIIAFSSLGNLTKKSVRAKEKVTAQIFQPWKCPINIFPTSLCMEWLAYKPNGTRFSCSWTCIQRFGFFLLFEQK